MPDLYATIGKTDRSIQERLVDVLEMSIDAFRENFVHDKWLGRKLPRLIGVSAASKRCRCAATATLRWEKGRTSSP